MKNGLVVNDLAPARVAAAFDARTGREDRADFLLRETELRMFDRLGYIRLDPVNLILDVGCGLGDAAELLGGRFAGAHYVGLDLSLAGLKSASRAAAGPPAGRLANWRRWLSRVGVGERPAGGAERRDFRASWLAADAHALPFAPRSVDLVWSNLCAHWFDDPVTAVAQWRQVLRPGGLLMFSLYGVDTLREVDGLGQPAGGASDAASAGGPEPALATLRYPDLHDWGDALVAAGFADPVMDVERLTLTYAEPAALARDAGGIRAGFQGPVSGLPPDGAVSIELIFGHAWRPLTDRRDDGLKPVRLTRREEIGGPDGARAGRGPAQG